MTLQHLIVLGAGPKAVSIAAKLEALRGSGFTVPKLTVLDPNGVAANWAGEILEYTDGRQDLATPPLKDVGFPYRSDAWDASNERVNSEMLSFSWQAYLVTDPYRGSEDFASWVDRGMHNPILKQWANYLSWVAGKVQFPIDRRRVVKIGVTGQLWDLTVVEDDATNQGDAEPGSEDHVVGDGLVITGPGPITPMPGYHNSQHPPTITDARNFWKHLNTIASHRRQVIGVIGSGGAAASVVSALLESTKSNFLIQLITPDGVIYSRGESYDENRHYSDPRAWDEFNTKSRTKFLEHTAAGVFSLAAKRIMDVAQNLDTIAGEVSRVTFINHNKGAMVYLKGARRKHYDKIVVAWGFDAMDWKNLLDGTAVDRITVALRGPIKRDLIKDNIGNHLEVEGLAPWLHLPMLADKKGPGFFGLMCLGLLSDRILEAYVY
ncbi:SidA/IucD/PvdA family monooxygenase [Streptomyces sp. NPDC028722]|uniref:SidA/IucD/PvdA family monooxygenase n=1 Tax=Streptomyces sp. NPDC028722 TaxID=3155016 RepID=UPI0033C476F6